MFLGYKNNKIIVVANTATEIEKMNKYCQFDKIEGTDKEFFLHNGEYVCEVPYEQQVEEMRQARADAYASEVDPMMSEYNRKKTFNLFKEGEEEALLKAIEDKVAEIKENNPYPVEESEEVIEDGLQREEKEIEEPAVELYSMEI